MKSFWVLCLAALLLVRLGGARAQQPTTESKAGPKAVPVESEPRHHLAFENGFVRAFRVVVAPKDATLLHEHARDYVYVTLGRADIVNAVLDKPEVHAELPDAEVHFARGGFAHVARNLSERPFRNLTIEFVEPQGEARNLCAKIVPGEPGPCEEKARQGYAAKPLFETDGARVEIARIDADAQKAEMTAGGRGALVAALDQAVIKVEQEGQARADRGQPPVILTTGGFLWLPGGSRRVVSNLRGSPSNLLLIFFPENKKKPAAAR